MNRARLEREKKLIIIAEENELLREDYMKCLTSLKEIYDSGELILNGNFLERL